MLRLLGGIARLILPKSLLKKMRGRDHDDKGSVVQRFIYDPQERFSLWLHYKRGGTYIDWYSKRLNRSASSQHVNTKEPSKEDEQRLVAYLETGHHDLAILNHFGMQQHHTLHEIGLGAGRSAQFFIQFLDSGNYSGNDISDERLRHAHELLKRKNLDEKNPILICNINNSFDWLGGKKYDYLYANSVFGHMPPEDVEEILVNVRKIMTDKTEFYFTVWGADPNIKTRRRSVKDWARNQGFWDDLGSRLGYEIRLMTDYKLPVDFVPNEARLMKLTIA